MLLLSIKRRLISVSSSSESLVPSIFPVLTRRMLLPCRAQPPFYPPSWNLYSDLCQTSTTDVCCHYAQFSEKNEVYVLINGWVTANYSVSLPLCCPPSWNLLSELCQTSTTHVRCHYAQFSEKNEVSILINGWVTANYSVSQSPFCPPSWNL